jgi:hypothetical protein
VGWLSLLGPTSGLKNIISLSKDELLATGGGSPAAAFRFNASTGHLLGKYQFPWEISQGAIANAAPFNNLNLIGFSKKNQTSFIANCLLGGGRTNALDCSTIGYSGVKYESLAYDPEYFISLALGRDLSNRTVATFFNPLTTSLTSFSFHLPDIESTSLLKTSALSPMTLFGGRGKENSIAVGTISLFPTPNIANMLLLKLVNKGSTASQENLINAAMILPGSLDSMIAGGIDLGEGMRPYVARLNKSLEAIVCTSQSSGSGFFSDLFFVQNKLYALGSTFRKTGSS